ncbi:MgtC/SapB family protein [Sphingomicrobium arenosum]|uniref:MgtC/SapB family protein n=1 Tax=Sphingomicrobium arenosum TaxID=2233861 RepID=UPI002240EB23|nr:MgtC/SapB family protein [Sphingomicrobium arenosum]
MNHAFLPDTMSLADVAIRMSAAVILPLLIGIERYMRSKPIDFRPFVIISVGAAGLVIGTTELLHSTTDSQSRIDPTRVIEGVITGIGFLGAGAMFRQGNFIQGAGSASAIWCAGAIGLICGMGEVWLAAIVTAIVLLLLVLSAPFTAKWDAEHEPDVTDKSDDD